ncbi:MAG: maleylacetoacetate isomerase [Gammaproteobacteria bacterium]|nr:maleylacetoacetate isomerase [Gammaproteobacteria bacterium]
MIIYDYFRSSAAYRVRIALNLKGLDAERRSIHLANGAQHDAAYKAINPQGFVPYLVEDDFQLSQSLAIIDYLDEKYPTPPLMPTNILLRARARQIALIVACDIHPLNNSRILGYLSNDLKVSDTVKTQWVCGWIHDGFVAIESLLAARQSPTLFCVGDTPSVADICLIPQVTNAHRFHCAIDNFPLIMGIYDAAMALPAFDLAQPMKQPDAF